ncbi:MAG: calcium/sodium antiporter [Fibrobacteraceae bacterium]|nr:calcium/sodium antiporter [Fibrobacteraceae bacterium]
MSLLLPILAIVLGLIVLVWSADRFVDGAVGVARFLGMSSLLIGIVIIGFGTSAPEMLVSSISSFEGNPQLALGNAYGSNIANIALILGVTALIRPLVVQRRILKKDLPILLAVSILAAFQLADGGISRLDAFVQILLFAGVMTFNVFSMKANKKADTEGHSTSTHTSLLKSTLWLIAGLVLLVASSRVLVWGAIKAAQALGVSDLLIGLTVVAVGTSLPELASSIAAARKGENDLVLGNIIGSNLFNTLMVVGIAGIIAPMPKTDPMIFARDIPVMLGVTLLLLILGFRKRGEGKLNRVAGSILLVVYAAYIAMLVAEAKPV